MERAVAFRAGLVVRLSELHQKIINNKTVQLCWLRGQSFEWFTLTMLIDWVTENKVEKLI